MTNLDRYIRQQFDVTPEVFLEILQTNPNARQNINGIMGEMLFKEYAESLGFEALRIKEKPGGGYNAKSDDARGDYYIKKRDNQNDEWFVVECKGVKSNSEKRINLTEHNSRYNYLRKHALDRNNYVASIYRSGEKAYNKAKAKWESEHKKTFPSFKWDRNNPGACIPDISGMWLNHTHLSEWLNSFDEASFSEDAYWELTAPIRVLQTHMPSIRTDPETNIKKTGPLVSEFNILSVDLFLKTGKHEFVFANSADLNPQAQSPNHLQQNYTIDILTEVDNFQRHELMHPWYNSIEDCISQTNPTPRKIDLSQLDTR